MFRGIAPLAAIAIALVLALLAGSAGSAGSANAAIIFAHFESDAGPFTQPANISPTTNILSTTTGASNPNFNARTSSADASDAAEGAHALAINIAGGGQSAPLGFPRIRLLCGDGTPANNIPFTTGPGTDGWIGFFYKVPVPGTLPGGLPSGLQLMLNLDASTNFSGDMDSGIARNAVMDGQWHVVEWDLDNPADWVATPGLGGNGVVEDGLSRTIDSIYFRYPSSVGWTGYTGTQTLFIDWVAKSDAGSIAPLIPEPGSLAALFVTLAALRRAEPRRGAGARGRGARGRVAAGRTGSAR